MRETTGRSEDEYPVDKVHTEYNGRVVSEFKGMKTVVSIGILFIINLLNYMDRFTIAGVLTDIQNYYKINDAQGGLLQTVFMVFFMIFSPMCGYLGDRYNRKWIMVLGITFWVATVFASTYIPANLFWLFLLLRGIVGIGEASYAVICPSIIADMFTGQNRSRMLMIFYFAIPMGSGMGFMVGSTIASLFGAWQWGVRITAILGVICLMLIIVFIEEPERGKAEREKGEITAEIVATSYLEDLKALVTNQTYLFSTAGYTAIVFVVGTLTWWAPTAILHKDAWKGNVSNTDNLSPSVKSQVNLMYGAITCIGGIIGVSLGTILSNLMRRGVGPFRFIQTERSDAIICAVGAIVGVPTLFFGIYEIQYNMIITWILMFICITMTCFNWATNVDMLMAVIIPSRRNSAMSWQILCSHLFGDASGPYILGLISDAIRGNDQSPYGHFHSLVISFLVPNAFLVLSTILFSISAVTFVKDHKKFKEEMGVVNPKRSIQERGISLSGQQNGAFSSSEITASERL